LLPVLLLTVKNRPERNIKARHQLNIQTKRKKTNSKHNFRHPSFPSGGGTVHQSQQQFYQIGDNRARRYSGKPTKQCAQNRATVHLDQVGLILGELLD